MHWWSTTKYFVYMVNNITLLKSSRGKHHRIIKEAAYITWLRWRNTRVVVWAIFQGASFITFSVTWLSIWIITLFFFWAPNVSSRTLRTLTMDSNGIWRQRACLVASSVFVFTFLFFLTPIVASHSSYWTSLTTLLSSFISVRTWRAGLTIWSDNWVSFMTLSVTRCSLVNTA